MASTPEELYVIADRAQAAAETVAAINRAQGNGERMPWSAHDLADFATHTRQEADER